MCDTGCQYRCSAWLDGLYCMPDMKKSGSIPVFTGLTKPSGGSLTTVWLDFFESILFTECKEG